MNGGAGERVSRMDEDSERLLSACIGASFGS
jgi:hypothetical protein